MARRIWSLVLGFAGLVATTATEARSDDSPELQRASRFLQALREKGMSDVAADYLAALGKAPDTPADLKSILPYEEGRTLLEEAASSPIDRRAGRLEDARAKLERFVKDQPSHVLAPEALMQLARLQVEAGHLAVLQANDAKNSGAARDRLVQARASFENARAAYAKSEAPLKAAYAAFPKSIEKGDPREKERDRAHRAVMNAQLERALVDYEDAQTYPAAAKERAPLLDKAIKAFDKIYKDYRMDLAGLYAHMWQGKCYEEKGDLGAAMGVYNDLMEHKAPELKQLQRQVGYYRIIVDAKRKNYALAGDEAVRWLKANPNRADRMTNEGLGVQLELAKSLLAQVPEAADPKEKDAATRKALETLAEVARVSSQYKAEAVSLQLKHKPKGSATPRELTSIKYDDAMAQADLAIAARDWDQAIALYKAAARRADPAKDSDKANNARYLMAYCYYMSKRYYEADVVAEHIARRYPKWEKAAAAAELGLASLENAYNEFSRTDRASDLERMASLADYTAKTWADADQGDAARVTAGEIALVRGKFLDAATAFESVREKSPKRLAAQVKAGNAHWKQSLSLRDDPKGAEAEAKRAIDVLAGALKARQEAKAPPGDADLVSNACDLAEIHLAREKPAEAVALLDPLVKAIDADKNNRPPNFTRLLSTELRAHIAAGKVDQAIGDMKALEDSGDTGLSLTQLYFGLGRLLEKEMESLKARKDAAGLKRTQDSYQKFLDALSASKTGQTFESLEWAGEQMLALGATDRAVPVFERVLKNFGSDAAFLKTPNANEKLLRTKLKLVVALRTGKEFEKSKAILDPLIKQNAGVLELLMERGRLLEDQAAATRSGWPEVVAHWKGLAARLGKNPKKPVEYYEAWYHVALALAKQGKAADAVRSLKSVMVLSPTVGGPEMKKKYEDLIRLLGNNSTASVRP